MEKHYFEVSLTKIVVVSAKANSPEEAIKRVKEGDYSIVEDLDDVRIDTENAFYLEEGI